MPPGSHSTDLCNQWDIVEIMVCDFWGWVIKDSLALLAHLLWGKLLPRHDDTQAALGVPQQPASAHQLCEWATFGVDPPALGKPSDDSSPVAILTAVLL